MAMMDATTFGSLVMATKGTATVGSLVMAVMGAASQQLADCYQEHCCGWQG